MKRQGKAFITTLVLVLSFFGMIYGFVTVYVNANNTISTNKIQAISINRTSFEKAELNLIGNKINIKIPQEIEVNPFICALVPKEIRLIWYAFNFFE